MIKTYLLKEKNTGYYKIGSSKNPSYREKTLQSQIPNTEIVKVWDKNIEKMLHNLYNKERVRGEWFNLTKTQVRYICTNKFNSLKKDKNVNSLNPKSKLDKKKYTVKQYAGLKNVTVGAVYKAIREDRVSYEKIGSVYLIIS